jgi:outer membrane beta-barrel protein
MTSKRIMYAPKPFPILAAMVVMAAWAGTAAAQRAESDGRRHWVTGIAGGQLADLTDELEAGGVSFQEEVNFGGRYQYNITPRWGIEGSVLYTPLNAEFMGTTREASVDTWYYNGNVVFNILPSGTFIPYVTGGAGAVTYDSPADEADLTKTRFAGNFGGGILVKGGERWGIRFDVRDYVYNVKDVDTTSVGTAGFPSTFDEIVHDLAFDVGISLSF